MGFEGEEANIEYRMSKECILSIFIKTERREVRANPPFEILLFDIRNSAVLCLNPKKSS